MTCAVCPNCVTDLERFEAVRLGDLDLAPHEIRWKGEAVAISCACRLLVSAVARAGGKPISLFALSEALGCPEESADPRGIIRTQTSFTRKAFRKIDPSFDALETVRGVGLRWAA
jgi:DNA-binding response OmpR family regulator